MTKDAYTIIPAQHGWYIALLIEGEDVKPYLSLEPIIAWEIQRHIHEGREQYDRVGHLPIAITANGNMRTVANPQAIKRPDGKFDCADGTCDSEQETIERLIEEREIERQLLPAAP